ncbi:MAG: hypothetical protein ACK5N4_12990 [Parabacteroides gordonii]|uniref:DUF4906 domain-containing protein n=1 Tax=Parabacteroides gordonii TaxID=574930 RepID=UPI003A85B5BE
MKHILYTISLLVLLGACTDESYTDELSTNGGKPGKPVPVDLSLDIQPLQSPLTAGTKAGGETVSSTEVCKGMEISLEKTPETRADGMSDVQNFWVFQFNGTEDASPLIQKQYYSGSSVKNVTLKTSSGRNRIIVIANADSNTFASLQTDGSCSLENFNNMGMDFNQSEFPLFSSSGGSPRPVLSGSTDIIVTENAQADIMLYRSIAQVRVNLRLGTNMQSKGYTAWSYQFMNIPEKSFYYAIGRTPDFPGDAVGYDKYTLDNISFSASSSYAATIVANLPVNLHHPVSFTTPEKRVTNAPVNSTYLQIMGIESTTNGTISRSVVYQIHLGSNFTDDYSVSPNYAYTYNIAITGENDDDSRVVKFIPGYFSGALKMYGADGSTTTNESKAVTWRYDKRIEVYISDVGGSGLWLASSSKPMPSANSLMDGRKNTTDLFDKKADYPAIQKCIDLNGTEVTSTNLEWYTPSFGQALGIYVSGSSTLKTLPNATYWTSSTDATNVWATNIWTGLSKGESPSGSYNLRCVKDLLPGNTAK